MTLVTPLALNAKPSSVIDMTEPICESDEIKRVEVLQAHGERALCNHQYEQALTYLSEALEMDSSNADLISVETAAYIGLGRYDEARTHAIQIINLNAMNAQGHYLNGICQKNQGQVYGALDSFLIAMQLDPNQGQQLTDQIAVICAIICDLNDSYLEEIKDLDIYEKLTDIGLRLFNKKHYDKCIIVIETSQQFKTNQKGITMRGQLTLAGAYSVTNHIDQSIALYQECCATAVSVHDYLYQTKALVSIASLYVAALASHQALVHYEKLLALQETMLSEFGSFESLPDFWTVKLRCGLHLNMSIAYKAIGSMDVALSHAQKYASLLDEHGMNGPEHAESYHNVGIINEILGNYGEAIENYRKYYRDCRRLRNRKGLGQAYGCLGSVYAQLHNWAISLAYHAQYVSIANKSCDQTLMMLANEMMGDTLMLKGDYEEARESYEAMLQEAPPTDYRHQATAKSRIADAFVGLNRREYAIHYYEKAMTLAAEMNYDDIETLCEYNLAVLYKTSSCLTELEKARDYFEKLIPLFEWKSQQYFDEGTFCSTKFAEKLDNCYNCLLEILSRIGCKDCLTYAEAFHLQSPRNILKAAILKKHTPQFAQPLVSCSMDKLTRIVAEQSANVLYYKILPDSFLLWMIQPAEGITSFYVGRSRSQNKISIIEEIKQHLAALKKGCNENHMLFHGEDRTIPFTNQNLRILQNKNELKSSKQAVNKPSSDICQQSGNDSPDTGDTQTLNKKPLPLSPVTKSRDVIKDVCEKPTLSTRKRLYNILLGAVDDILRDLPTDSPIIVIANGFLHDCPFEQLEDFQGVSLGSKLRVTYLANLTLLMKASYNELDRLVEINTINRRRSDIRRGGFDTSKNNRVLLTSVGHIYDSMSDPALKPHQVPNLLLLTTIRHSANAADIKGDKDTSKWSVKFGDQCLAVKEVQRYDRKLVEQQLSRNPQNVQLHFAKTPIKTQRAKVSVTTVTSVTATETDITSSNLIVPEFQQIAYPDRCVLIGDPILPKTLHLPKQVWSPVSPLQKAYAELQAVASYVETHAITGEEATKERFQKEAATATVLHIATYTCNHRGYLVFTPDFSAEDNAPPLVRSYLITPQDIVSNKLRAQLVVLSGGSGPLVDAKQCTFLADLFISAGAQCVLMKRWPVPDDVTRTFLYHFYTSLQHGSYTSTALKRAVHKLKDDTKYSEPYYWSTFILVGVDVFIDIKAIRHSQLDQTLNTEEAKVEEMSGHGLLNPRIQDAHIASKEGHLTHIQTLLGELMVNHKQTPNLLAHLIDLVDTALKRLHAKDNHALYVLPHVIAQDRASLSILRLLWFNFITENETGGEFMYVTFPHWNVNDLLVPIYDALRAVTEISENKELSHILHELLPLSQNLISHLADVLCITRHAPEIKLKITDTSVRPLWDDDKIQALVTAIGFHQIGPLINFKCSPHNRSLLTFVLQFLLAMSCHKSPVLLHKLDVNLLGKPSPMHEPSSSELHRLPSLAPLLLRRNQLTMATPWLTTAEQQEEMLEKIELANSKDEIDKKYDERLYRAKIWHKMNLVTQANESLANYGQPKKKPTRVNRSRDLMESNRHKTILRVSQSRNDAHCILEKQLNGISVKHRDDVNKLYLPYITGN